LSDLTKVDVLFNDLDYIEKSLKSLILDHSRVSEERSALEARLTRILEENKTLRQKVSELEAENESLKSGSMGLNTALFEKLSEHEKELMIQKINEIIVKINRHLINL
jgi:hypothetical protein